MKARTILWSLLVSLPIMGFAQNEDDMYFIPKKKTKSEKTTIPATTVVPSRQYEVPQTSTQSDYHSGMLRDVDEYNRRGTGRNITIITETDTFQVDESQLV